MEQGAEMNQVEAAGIYKVYRERRGRPRSPGCCIFSERCLVLKNIAFSIDEGSFTCFLGPSGCGKSTLLRIIAGFDRPTDGRVLINGLEVTAPSPEHVFIFQEDGLFPWMTALENVSIGARHISNPDEKISEVLEYLDLVGLKGFEDYYPHELSGGMRRRAEVARALITNPGILFMDEPFGALDFVTRMQMREEMVNVHEMFESTILFITHDIDEALHLGDQIIILGERPSTVKSVITLPFGHPRDISRGELADLRKEIYFLMGLHTAL